MIEIGNTYTRNELIEMFGKSNNQGLKRKLEGYGVGFTANGRGDSMTLDIESIANPFKIFCVSELGFNGNTDFTKLLHFYYYFFNDEEFMTMPDEVKEHRMRASEKSDISRQTIAGYTQKLVMRDLISRSTNDYIFYFAYKHQQRIVERAEYLDAWHNYWADLEDGENKSGYAINRMIDNYGGIARKQAVLEVNGIYLPKIEYLKTLIHQELEAEVA